MIAMLFFDVTLDYAAEIYKRYNVSNLVRIKRRREEKSNAIRQQQKRKRGAAAAVLLYSNVQ